MGMDDNRVDDISYAGVGVETWATLLSTRGCGNKNVCLSTFWRGGGGGGE